MSRHLGTLFGLGLMAFLGLVLLVRQVDFDVDVPFFSRDRAPASTGALRQAEPPPYAPPTISDVRGALEVVGDQPAITPELTVTIEAPSGAEAMQLGTTSNFDGVTWQPLADRATVPVAGIGYQQVFVRFQLADGTVSSTSVVGGEVDPFWEAATASAEGPHEASWVRPFSSTELAVRIEAGRIEAGGLEPYDLDNPPAGDRVEEGDGLTRITRDGETIGLGVSERRDVIRRPDRLIGEPLDGDELIGGDWTVTSLDDPIYAEGITPVSIRHIARPTDGGFDGDYERLWAVVHDVVIVLPEPLQPGATYEITPPGVAPSELAYDPATNTSPAIRVNQVGFAPADQVKVAELSGWFDGIGDTALADLSPAFRVVDEAGTEVASGTGRARPTGNELLQGDLTGSPVVELDFSDLEQAGTYRVCVDNVGCSHPFEIRSGVWSDVAATVARSLYHQRSGLQLEPPYTSFIRPRGYHPDDGVVVLASAYSLIEAQTETDNTDFTKLAEERTNEVVDGAWGGHFDAGDWDRRIQHLWMARSAAELVMLHPDRFAAFELNIPESGDAVPDLLDEALWTIDIYQRMQTDDGAIRGGVEASEHPPPNTTSWTDDLAVLAYAPDPYATYVYAGAAAEMSVALRPYDPFRADELLDSAERAMEWAESQDTFAAAEDTVAAQRNVAAAAMLFATGESRWHDRFVETATFLSDAQPSLSCQAHTACDAAWLYVQTDPALTDPAIRTQLMRRFLDSADEIVRVGQETSYGWTLENPTLPLIWGLGVGGTPKITGLMRAYELSGDETYRAAAVRSAAVSLGSNPLGRSMITGLGEDPVRNPQINDVKYGGLPTWPGTPVYGYHMLNAVADEQWVVDDLLGPAGVSPSPTELPYLWQWYDVDSIAQYNEFTVHQSQGDALFGFALLAATS